MKLHGLKSCDTVRKALKALRAAGLSPEFRDFREDAPDVAEIERWLQALGPGLLNRASTTWRGLDEAEKALPPAELMARHPALIKRPVIEEGDRLTLGWKPDVQALWLGAA
ncbi:arsenate reductase family protein [Frigidibacter sp. ROC022]|uniref:arsenate reductase family protein n=1 Tax=Frigidibacter sp. ROC022 TaxID=2971796 RepID=UPI00215A9FBC|nr:ArsC/Spx/MgsR family protein [Frigidibacter sp. ROC022]MCR8723043.1 arsenate reductase [Frigidibacter sp. ROC022]